ncbi:hypothetical protein B7Y94_03560 [Candidatus Saccharibacteria bacterium 32-49-12]|nr:MAG: hypothetical protein B7Y94_03560 [Candidatus Saccharibacteria bacterium 32-49-12]
MHLKQWIMRYRLPAFLIGVIVLAIVLVLISMNVYYRSGAYQLDLSRPEYKSVRSQIDTDKKTRHNFEAQGPINSQVLEDFLRMYDEEARRVIEADAYSADVLSNEQLGI